MAKAITTELLNIKGIRRDGNTQPRVGLHEDTVAEYTEVLRGGTPLPPVEVMFDGKEYWLYDGFHRVEAHQRAGGLNLHAHIHEGTQRDAVLASLGVNAAHGLRRSNEDKRRAVMRLLEDEEWREWSDSEIARQCNVSHTFVAKLRESYLETLQDSPTQRTVKRGGKEYVQDTANIGSKAEKRGGKEYVNKGLPAEVWEVEAAIRKHFQVVGLEAPIYTEQRRGVLEHLLKTKAPVDFVKYIGRGPVYIRERDFKQARDNLLEQLRQETQPITPTLSEDCPELAEENAAIADSGHLHKQLEKLRQSNTTLRNQMEQVKAANEKLLRENGALQEELLRRAEQPLEFPRFPGNPAVHHNSPGPTDEDHPKANRVEYSLVQLGGAAKIFDSLKPPEFIELVYSPAERCKGGYKGFERYMQTNERVREALAEYMERTRDAQEVAS